jgi:hypothetical protein
MSLSSFNTTNAKQSLTSFLEEYGNTPHIRIAAVGLGISLIVGCIVSRCRRAVNRRMLHTAEKMRGPKKSRNKQVHETMSIASVH